METVDCIPIHMDAYSCFNLLENEEKPVMVVDFSFPRDMFRSKAFKIKICKINGKNKKT